MKALLSTILVTATIFAAQRAAAQQTPYQQTASQEAATRDSLSIRDAAEIRHQAEQMVKVDLNFLLNSISSNNFESTEIQENIHNSYSDSRNQIFHDSTVRVEPDIDPTTTSSTIAGDVLIDRYLRDLDFLYNKTDSNTIEFTNIRTSGIKKKDNIYLKVYFNSVFRGKSKVKDQNFSPTNRYAEVWAKKLNGQWHLYIVKLAFFNPTDTAGDAADNMPLKFETNPFMNLSAQATAADSLAAVAKQQTFEEEQQQKYADLLVAKERLEKEQFDKLLLLADDARKNQEFTAAQKYYKQASDMQPNSVEVRRGIRRTLEDMQEFTIKTETLFKEYMTNANLFARKRQYKQALDAYQEARKLKPTESGSIDSIVTVLTVKYTVLDDLQEKYNTGDMKLCQKACRDAIKKDKTNPDLYYMLGRTYEALYVDSKGNENAEANYSTSIDLDPYNLAAIKARAELYTRTNNYYKAVSDYKRFLTVDKMNMDMYERKSEIHVMMKLEDEAIADLDEAIAVNPKASHIYLAKGLLQYKHNDFAKAAANFTTCLRLDSANALAWFNRGRCEIGLNKVPTAASDFAKARNLDLDSSSRLTIMDYAESYYNFAVGAFSRNRMDSAIVDIDFAISIDPSSALDRFTRGEYFYSLGNYKEAIGAYDEAIGINNSYMQAWYSRGMARMGIADYKEAITNFQTTLKLAPANVLAEKGVGDAQLALSNFGVAADAFEGALRLSESAKPVISPSVLADIYNAKSKAYFELANYEKAVSDAKNAIKYDRNFAEAYFNRGNAYYKQSSLSDAIEDIGKAVGFEDRHPRWHYVLAEAYEDKKAYGDAVSHYAACIQQDSTGSWPLAIYKQGYCDYLLQNYEAAIPFYSKALKMQLDTGVASFNIEFGATCLNSNRFDSATSFYQKAYAKDSTNGYAAYGIATVLVLQNKPDESFPWFEKAFATKIPSYSEIKKDKLLADFRKNKKFKDLLNKYYK